MMRKKRAKFESPRDDGSDNKFASRLSKEQAMKAMKEYIWAGRKRRNFGLGCDTTIAVRLYFTCLSYS